MILLLLSSQCALTTSCWSYASFWWRFSQARVIGLFKSFTSWCSVVRKMQAFAADESIVRQPCLVCPFCPQSSMIVFGNRKQLVKHINSEPGHSSGRDVPSELEMVPAVKIMHSARVRWIRETPILGMALPRYHWTQALFDLCGLFM